MPHPKRLALLGAAFLATLSFAVPASAQTVQPDPSTMSAKGQGINGFGRTADFEMGFITSDTYSHGYYCDTSVPAKSSSGCEVGTTFKMPPRRIRSPLHHGSARIHRPDGTDAVPRQTRMHRPPVTIDLSAIGLPGNAMTPGHDHFTTTRNGGMPEWWDVQVIGVTSKAAFERIRQHGSYAYIEHLIKSGSKDVTKPLPTNLFLYFAVGT